MSKNRNIVPLILSGLHTTFPRDESESDSLISNNHSCQDTMVISRKMLPFYLLCREVGQDEGEWEQTVGLVCCCVLPCLGFHRPDDYRLIPGDSFLTQEILPSVRLTELISLFQISAVKIRGTNQRNMPGVAVSGKDCTEVFIRKKTCDMFVVGTFLLVSVILHCFSFNSADAAERSRYLCLVNHLDIRIIQGIFWSNPRASSRKRAYYGLQPFT